MDPRKPPLSPAFYRYKSAKLNWRQIQTANFEELVKKSNLSEIQELLRNLASAHLDEEEVARFRGPALQKLLELTQKGVQLLAGNNPEAESSIEGVKCQQCAKRFISDEYLSRHISRRHAPALSAVLEPSKDPLFMQKAVGFLQEEFEQMREASEKQLGETLNGLQFLLEKSDTLARNRYSHRPQTPSSPANTLNLLGELAKAQKQLLEYDTLTLKNRLLATPETPPTAPATFRAAIIEEDLDLPVKRALFTADEQTKPTLSDAEIEVEFTESSQSQQALQETAKLIGFDLFSQPKYRHLAESLLQSPIPAPWIREDNGISLVYRNTKTWETSLFHPKLEAYQRRYRLLERAKTIGASMRLELVESLPKVRSLEGKYDGRFMNYFAHNEGEITRKRAEFAILTSNLQIEWKRTDSLFVTTRNQMEIELNRLFSVCQRTAQAAVSLEEASTGSVLRVVKQMQASELPGEPSPAPVSSATQAAAPAVPFSRYFLTPASSILHQGTLIGANSDSEAWTSKSLRDISTLHGLISKSDTFPPLPFSPMQFTESDMVLTLTGRWNGLNKLHMVWRGPPRSEVYDIEWN
jgi:hypothetical protein